MINLSPPNAHNFPFFPLSFTIYSIQNMGLETEEDIVLWKSDYCKKKKKRHNFFSSKERDNFLL